MMFCKKMYIVLAVFLAVSGSILTWVLFYEDFPHNSPVRAKQVFNIKNTGDLSSNFFSKYNTTINVQTIGEARSFY